MVPRRLEREGGSTSSNVGLKTQAGLSVLLLVGLGSIWPGAAEGAVSDSVEIVRDGRPRAYLVVASDAHVMVKEAAEDLRWAVREATGVALEMYPQARPGGSRRAVHVDVDPGRDKDLPYDSAIVTVSSGEVRISGPTPAGTANAMATVLMEDLGVRMYYPNPLFTIVSRKRDIGIRSRTVSPQFAYRLWSGVTGREAAAYVRRNRLTDSRVPIPRWGFGHNLATIISVAAHGKDHPEYFPLRDGKRLVRGSDVGDTPQPCFTNPDVLRLTIEAARRFFDRNPRRDTFSLCVNDNPWYCECPNCAALDKPYRDLPVGRQYSESYFDYVSKVAEAIAQSHPDRFLGVYAYWNVEQPPRNRKALPANVVVALTQDTLQHYDPAYRKKDHDLVRTWANVTARLHMYTYYGLGWLTPRTSPTLVAEDLRFIADNKVRAIYCEAYPFWAWCGPMHYVASRLQWDTKADVDRILDEFHRDCFGEVATEMRAYHDTCERYWTRQRPGRWFEGLDNLSGEEAMADLSLLSEARGRLEAALTKARNATVRERIAWLKTGFDLSTAIGDAFEAKRDPADATTRLTTAQNAVATAYARLLTEPAYGHSYYDKSGRWERKRKAWFDRSLQTVKDKPPRGPTVASQPASRPSSTLREVADRAGLLVGAAIDPGAFRDQRYADTLAREFNFVTSENVMKWGPVHLEPTKWNFGPADALVDFALKHKMKVKGHCLIWHEALPKWVNAEMAPDQLRVAMRAHIRTLVSRYKGRVYSWDVLNEAVDDKQGLRKTLFLDKLGEGYIAEAFRLAHEADPAALLNYNDFGGEGLGGKSDRIYELVKKLKAEGVPIHGVGLQMHISAAGYPKPEDIAANVRRLAGLGLKVNISEMDVRVKDIAGDRDAKLKKQRQVYHDVIAACLKEKDFIAVTFWGFTDAHSWVDHFFGADDPLLFDEKYQPKPAYDGVHTALWENAVGRR